MAARLRGAEGVPAVVVNNAGGFLLETLERTTPDAFDAQLAVNLRGSFLLARAFLPAMRDAGGGSFISIGSVADHTGFPENAAYAASKYGLRGLHETLVAEYPRQRRAAHARIARRDGHDHLGSVRSRTTAGISPARGHAPTGRRGRSRGLRGHSPGARPRGLDPARSLGSSVFAHPMTIRQMPELAPTATRSRSSRARGAIVAIAISVALDGLRGRPDRSRRSGRGPTAPRQHRLGRPRARRLARPRGHGLGRHLREGHLSAPVRRPGLGDHPQRHHARRALLGLRPSLRLRAEGADLVWNGGERVGTVVRRRQDLEELDLRPARPGVAVRRLGGDRRAGRHHSHRNRRRSPDHDR